MKSLPTHPVPQGPSSPPLIAISYPCGDNLMYTQAKDILCPLLIQMHIKHTALYLKIFKNYPWVFIV